MSNDMGAQQNYQRSLLDAISTVVQRRIDGLKLDKTIVGIIDKNMGTLNGRPLYQVKYEGGVFTATARDSSESYARNTAVYVTVPQSDFSKEKFIVGRASSISASTAEDTAISATINNYVKLGGNLIDGSASIGLRSYHDPIEEETDSDSILHRARFLYNVDPELTSIIDIKQDAFKVYMQDAKNILLKADFRTLLDATQQRTASGRYGLAVTLTFANPNAGYGETQGEILDNLGSTIIGSAPRLNIQGKVIDTTTNTSTLTEENNGWVSLTDNIDNISLKEWDNKLQLFLNSNDAKEKNSIESWQTNGIGLFDCYSQYIQTMYQTFCINNSAARSAMTDNLIAAYINLLSDLKNADSNLDSIKKIYDDWKAVSIGDLSDVDETIYLTSDVMLGNPFGFSSWNTQYVVSSQQYDFSRFKEVKSILFFKEGFQEDSNTEQIWPPSDAPVNGGKGWDIFCQNIELFLLKDLDAEYQDLSLRVECANGSDGILRTLLPTEKVTFNAHVFRNYIEELTGNANIEYVWLRQDSQVINASHPDFYHYAGVGWKRLRNTNRYLFQTTGNENWAYKNIYKCVALYQDGTQTVPLSTNFIVYNNAVSTKIKLESDLGTNFTFSEGSPTISCLIQEEPLPGKIGEAAENYQEYGYINDLAPLYKYHWSIRDIANDSVLFLEEVTSENNSNILKENILSKIKMWCFDFITQELKETDDPTRATRIQYPVSLSSGGFIVECIVQKNFSLSKENELLTEHLIFTKYTEDCSEIWNQYQKDYQILSQWEEELNEVDAINNQYETQRNNIWNRYKDDSEAREAEIRELEERYEEIFSQLNQKYIENKENREKYPDLFKETYQESVSAFKETYTTLFSDLKESVLEDVEDLPHLEEFFEKFTVTIETNFDLKNQSKNISSWLCDKCDYYNVGNATIDITNLSTVSSSSYRIAIENGDQVFQYDVYGNAPTETKFKDPLEIKPLKAKIIGPTGLEFSGENANVEWIFNLEDTLIVPPEGLVLNPATQQEQIIKGPECTFTIEKLYNPNAQNNQITCHAHFNDIDVYTDTTFNFSKVGSNGTNGTDVVSTIKFDEEKKDRYFVLHNQPLTLYVQKGCPIPDSEETQTKGMLNVPGVGSTLETTIKLTPDVLDVHLYQKGEEVDKSKFAGGYPKWNLAGNANGTTNNTGKYFKIDKDADYNIVWDPTYHDDKKSLLLQTIRSEVSIAESDQTYYSFFSLPIIEYEPDSTLVNDRLPIQRIAIDKNSYLKDVVYNSDGRNPIYNHNQGLKLINLPENSMITWEARGGLNATKSDKSNIVTEYFETEPCFSLGFEKNADKKKAFSKVYTQREITLAQRKKVYEQEKEEARKNYYIEDENGNISNGPLYDLYLAEYEKEKEKILINFKQERLKALQTEAKKKFIRERIDVKKEDKKEGLTYWTRNEILNGQRDDMELIDCFWFSQHVDLWWDSGKTITITKKEENKTIIGSLYLDEKCENPVYVWDESRYLLNENQEKENNYKKYETLYFKKETITKEYNENTQEEEEIKTEKIIVSKKEEEIIEGQKKYIYKRSIISPSEDNNLENLSEDEEPIFSSEDDNLKDLSEEDKEFISWFNDWFEDLENQNSEDENLEGKEDYIYSIITKKIEPSLDAKTYFNSVYPTYNDTLSVDTRVIEDNSSEAMIYVLPNDTYDGSATNNRIEAKIYILEFEQEQSNSEDSTDTENSSEENNTSDNDNTNTQQSQFKLYATVYVPINMTLDTFGLDSINAWDGNSVTIDEERGAILAPQVGAGEKDSNNRFTGILMGKTNTYTGQSDSEDQIGLFGYSYGIQSIFLDAKTGNADFGLPNGNSLQLDSKGNYIGLKNDDYNEGRIELRPGGVSKVGGWRLGHRSLYYTKSGNIGPRYKGDYIPNIKTGIIEQSTSEPYSGHHEKDIDYKDSGILMHSGDDPYISIKGRELTEDDISPDDLDTYLRPKDSLEIQLDPKAPTLFTIFRHNGSNWVKPTWIRDKNGKYTYDSETTVYEEGTRTYLAGINGKGEFVANTVNSIVDLNDQTKSSVYSTQFSVNSFAAFDDKTDTNKKIKFAEHTGLKIKIGPYTIGQLFINNKGLNPLLNNDNDTTLYITGGQDDPNKNEYTRPIGLYGEKIKLYAPNSESAVVDHKKSDSSLVLSKNSLETIIGQTKFILNRSEDSSLMSTNNFKTNIGIEQIERTKLEILCNNVSINVTDEEYPTTYIYYKYNDKDYYIEKDSWDTTKYIYNNQTYIPLDSLDKYYKIKENKTDTNYYTDTEFDDNTVKYYVITHEDPITKEKKKYYVDTTQQKYEKVTKVNKANTANDDDPVETKQYVPSNSGTYYCVKTSSSSFFYQEKDTDTLYYYVFNRTNNKFDYIPLSSPSIDKGAIYYLINNKIQENTSSFSKFYYVQIGDIYQFVNINNLDGYPNLTNDFNSITFEEGKNKAELIYDGLNDKKMYIYINGKPTSIIGLRKTKEEKSFSRKKYSFYAGDYEATIIASDNIDKKIKITGNSNGINLLNTTDKSIIIKSSDKDFDIQTNQNPTSKNYSYRLGFFTGPKWENQTIQAGFFINAETRYGLFMTNAWTGLEAQNGISLYSPKYTKIVSNNIGSGNFYSQTNPQIRIEAGNQNNKDNSWVQLILNSSNNGWKSAVGTGFSVKKFLSRPVFKVKTSTASIGIYPRHYSLEDGTSQYQEFFYVNASQYNSSGLSIGGELPDVNNSIGLVVQENARFGKDLIVIDDITTSGNISAVKNGKGKIIANYFKGNKFQGGSFHGDGTNLSTTSDTAGADDSGGLSDNSPEGGATLGKGITITGPKVTRSSNGRPKIGTSTTTIKYAMPSAAQVGADPAGSAAAALKSAKSYVDGLLKNYVKSISGGKNISYKTGDGISHPVTIEHPESKKDS